MRQKIFYKLIPAALIFGIVIAAVFQGVMWYRAGRTSNSGALTGVPIDELSAELPTEAPEASGTIPVETAAQGAQVTDVSGVVENVMPAVVAINCVIEETVMHYDFFGRGYESKSESASSGTGIIVGQSANSILIVTNNHVVENAKDISVQFFDGTSSNAEIKGTESANDLAVIAVGLNHISKETFPKIRMATLGNSDHVKIGEFVIAIGNALGYGQSVTVGYVSALDREVTTENVTQRLIQVDAAINPGNSGGALLNANGEVIGINSVKYSDTTVERVGYAIPISTVLPIIQDLMTREQLKAGESAYLGIVGKTVSAAHANSFRMPEGVYVTEVSGGSPASEAGLHVGDVIVGMNGREIRSMDELLAVLGYTRGGTQATLQVKSLVNGNYEDKELHVVLGYRKTGK